MPTLIKHTFRNGPHEYEVELSWDDGAFVEDGLSFEVSASHMITGNPDSRQSISASLAVSRDADNEPAIFLNIGAATAEWKLRELLEESQLIDNIPAAAYGLGDPFTGCLVRSGLSALVGQIIECKNQGSGVDWFYPRVRSIGRCMKEHVPTICAKSAFRAAKCMAFSGVA